MPDDEEIFGDEHMHDEDDDVSSFACRLFRRRRADSFLAALCWRLRSFPCIARRATCQPRSRGRRLQGHRQDARRHSRRNANPRQVGLDSWLCRTQTSGFVRLRSQGSSYRLPPRVLGGRDQRRARHDGLRCGARLRDSLGRSPAQHLAGDPHGQVPQGRWPCACGERMRDARAFVEGRRGAHDAARLDSRQQPASEDPSPPLGSPHRQRGLRRGTNSRRAGGPLGGSVHQQQAHREAQPPTRGANDRRERLPSRLGPRPPSGLPLPLSLRHALCLPPVDCVWLRSAHAEMGRTSSSRFFEAGRQPWLLGTLAAAEGSNLARSHARVGVQGP